jgi:hypothetical protein
MLLGPVAGRGYLGGSGVWGAIMAVQGAGAVYGILSSLTVLATPAIRAIRWRDSPAPAPSPGADATLAPKGGGVPSGLWWSGGWRKPRFGRLP